MINLKGDVYQFVLSNGPLIPVQAAKNFKINPKLIVVASIDSSGLATARPKNTVLNTDKLKRVLGGKILKISDGLAALEKDYLKEFGIIRQ